MISIVSGVAHGDELYYVFGYPLANRTIFPDFPFISSWTDDDIRMSQEIMTLWSNFAKYGYEVNILPRTETAIRIKNKSNRDSCN